MPLKNNPKVRPVRTTKPSRRQVRYATTFKSIGHAMDWCTNFALSSDWRVPHSQGKRPCIVLDIDQTIVRNNGTAIAPVIKFAKRVHKAGYKIYLVTARPDWPENRLWTVGQLKKLGIEDARRPHARSSILYHGLFMMPQKIYNSNASNFSKYKYVCRIKHIKENILINVGDQWDDLLLRPPRSMKDHAMHQKLYYLGQQSPVLVGINVSPCSLVSVKLPMA